VADSSDQCIAIALSGGGSRAVAFHLGCLRALHDLELLQKVKILSTVSGGSVIGAAYAYLSYADFEDFDRSMVALLRRGLQRRLLVAALFSSQMPRILCTAVISGSLGVLLMLLRKSLGLVRWMVGVPVQPLLLALERLEKKLPVFGSLTTALEKMLDRQLFKGAALHDVRQADIEIVINACDLKTGTAFRFGSRTSGGWRYGRIRDSSSISVAKAVAASAAFPMLLPPLIERFSFVRGSGQRSVDEVVLTDGGVFDNLGVSVLEPGRSSSVSVNVHKVTHIICLNAGAGQFPGDARTLRLAPRINQAFETAYRRAQDAAYGRMHQFVETGQLSGFVMSYLGQDDSKLPAPPPDLVPRSAVRDYPTDFAAMSDSNIALLAKRGEQLTRLLVTRYFQDVR